MLGALDAVGLAAGVAGVVAGFAGTAGWVGGFTGFGMIEASASCRFRGALCTTTASAGVCAVDPYG